MAAESILIVPSFYASNAWRKLLAHANHEQTTTTTTRDGAAPSVSSWSHDSGKTVPRRIAIVDDEEDLISIYSMILSRLGYQTEFIAQDGDEIVQAITDRKINPDVIIMDYRMPRMNGLEASERIMQINPSIRIVIVTADDSTKVKAVAAGFGYLQKPFSISQLSECIMTLGERAISSD